MSFDPTKCKTVPTFDHINRHPAAVAKLRNLAPRRIGLNVVDELTGDVMQFDLMPGLKEGVPVTASVLQAKFTKALLADGALLVEAI